MLRRLDKLHDIRTNPNNHRHTFDDLKHCAMDGTGVLDLELFDAHVGTGPGPHCDVTSGPCSCGKEHGLP